MRGYYEPGLLIPSHIDEMIEIVSSHIPLTPKQMDYQDLDAYAEQGIGIDSEYCPEEYDL